MWDLVFSNANILTHIKDDVYHTLSAAALAITDNKISWLGEMKDIDLSQAKQVVDLNGQWILPGFIDCHTHLVFAGDRSFEFEMRQQGASYESIAKAGGGIVNTVKATREASFEALYDLAVKRLQPYFRQGVTTLEIKSGYGLNLETELKQLRVAKKLNEDFPIQIKTTFLGAHTVPAEYKDQADKYIDYLCREVLPMVAEENLADFVDVFTETIGFDLKQSEKIFQAAEQYGLKIKCHAEQLSRMGATSLACEYQAVSVDHIEYINEADIAKMKQHSTTAVLLPSAFYYLKETQKPPIQALKKAQVNIALATDFNPGSSPTNNLLLIMNLACVLWGMTPQDALKGITEDAACALAMQSQVGKLAVGMNADCSLWDIEHPRVLASMFDVKTCSGRVVNGSFITQNGG